MLTYSRLPAPTSRSASAEFRWANDLRCAPIAEIVRGDLLEQGGSPVQAAFQVGVPLSLIELFPRMNQGADIA